jgi:arylsulfatase A-like enzyme
MPCSDPARRLALVLAMLGCGVSGCRQVPGEPALAIHSRWIEDAPQELFSYPSITRLEEADVWGPETADPAAEWQSAPTLKARRNKPTLETQQLQRDVDFDAGDADVLEIAVHPTPKRLTLVWATGAGAGTADRSLTLKAVDAADGVFRFAVGTAPEWSGRVRRLRLSLTTTHRQLHRVTRSAARRFALQGDRLSAALDRPWQVALYGDARSALLNLPGTVVERRMQVPDNARLRFSYALPETATVAVAFQVLAQGPGRETAEPEVLFEDLVDPGAGDAAGWRQADVDLGRFAGKTLTFQLANPADGALDPLDGMPAWAHPEVLAPAARPRPPNLVLISIDTLRADHLSLYGYPRPTSPNIDRWARSGAVFDAAVTSAPWTLPSHLSLFTGLDALRHGVNHPNPAPGRLTLMAEHLRAAGYATAAVTGGSFLHPKFGLNQGFDFYRSSGVDRADELADGIARAIAWLTENRRRPFFFFFHTYEIHDPYEPRQPWFGRFAEASADAEGSVVTSGRPRGQRGAFRLQKTFNIRYADRPDEPLSGDSLDAAVDRYDSGIAYVDAEIGKLLARLHDLDLDDDTVVVLTSDHGESLGEHDLAGHGYLYDDNLLVPLIVAAPGRDWKGRRIGDQVRLIDVLPTVLELAGQQPAPGIDGLSLLPLIEGGGPAAARQAFSYSGHYNNGLALRLRNHLKYVFLNTPWRPLSDAEEVYRLSEDPGELHDASGSEPRLAELRKEARSYFEAGFSGLRIVIENGGEKRLQGELRGKVLSPFSVRTTNLGAACKWQRGKGLTYTLPPGKSLELWIENVQSAELRFAGAATFDGGAAKSFETDLTVAELAEPETVRLGGGAELSFAWVGERDLHQPSPVEADAELQKQLEALGYI